jgi:hypothetical protein
MIEDMPKLHSPFIREKKDGKYVVVPKIEEGYEWVFNDQDVLAIEKLHGTNVSIYLQEGVITSVWNRTARVPFFNRGKEHIIDGVREAYRRKYTELLLDGQHFGECIGPKINGNPYKLDKPLWIPFSRLLTNYSYTSWGKYPKTFNAISEWFKELMPLFGRKSESEFVEGIVFTHPDGRMAKLRRDMFDWYAGQGHGQIYKKNHDE